LSLFSIWIGILHSDRLRHSARLHLGKSPRARLQGLSHFFGVFVGYLEVIYSQTNKNSNISAIYLKLGVMLVESCIQGGNYFGTCNIVYFLSIIQAWYYHTKNTIKMLILRTFQWVITGKIIIITSSKVKKLLIIPLRIIPLFNFLCSVISGHLGGLRCV